MDIPRMDKEEAKAKMGTPGFTIIDVRKSQEKEKIKNAILEDPKNPESWMNKYPKENLILLYCS